MPTSAESCFTAAMVASAASSSVMLSMPGTCMALPMAR